MWLRSGSPDEWLLELVDDSDPSVCLAVAERLTPAQLLPLRFHSDIRVRYEAAGRVSVGALDAMRKDEIRWCASWSRRD